MSGVTHTPLVGNSPKFRAKIEVSLIDCIPTKESQELLPTAVKYMAVVIPPPPTKFLKLFIGLDEGNPTNGALT